MAKIEFDGQPVEISDPNQKNLVAEVSTKVTAVAIHVMSITPFIKGDSETLFVCRFENCVMLALHTASSEELSQMSILNMFPFFNNDFF